MIKRKRKTKHLLDLCANSGKQEELG